MWKKASKKNDVWYFDATGSIHKDIKNQKKPFLYSLVFHDASNHSIIPVYEFFTTSHTQTNISKYLGSLKAIFDSQNLVFPKIVVMDNSLALINSIVLSFNNCTLSNYLNWCYDLCLKNVSDQIFLDLMKIKIYICSTHFLKNIIRKAKLVKIADNVIKSFVFMFSLIQNSISINQIDNYLINVYNIFNNKFLDSTVIYSLNIITLELRERNISKVNISEANTPQEQKRDNDFDYILHESNIYFSNDLKNSTKYMSPFFHYYESKISEYKEKIKILSNHDQQLNKKNQFYSPELFNLIQNKLYLLPLWTGVIIKSHFKK